MRAIPLAAGLLACVLTPAAGAVTLYPLTITVRDSVTDAPCAARVSVWDSLGGSRFPNDVPQNSLFHLANGGYFYTQGVSHVEAPQGPTAVVVTRGPQYRPGVVVVRADRESTVTVRIGQWIALADSGWFSGDAHTHIDHAETYYTLTPTDAKWMADAEGVNVANCLDNDYYFTGAPDPVSDASCIVYMAEENRASVFGHTDFLGITQLVSPYFGELGWPMIADLAESVHAQPNGVVVAAHPVTTDRFSLLGVWPGTGLARELPVDAALGHIDAFDVASYSNGLHRFVETALWYQLLNCELAIGASAGTDAAMNRIWDPPMGGYQVFAHSESLAYAAWCAALKAQRTFVTNGPMITHFDVDGHAAGDSLSFTGPGPFAVSVALSVRSHFPVHRVEIVRNANVEASLALPGGVSALDTTVALSVPDGSWIAARVWGASPGMYVPGDSLFAHTSPVYVRVNGRRAVHPDDAGAMVAWIDSLVALTLAHGAWESPADSMRVFDTFAAGRAYYAERAELGTTRVSMSARSVLALRCTPQPARSGATFVWGAARGPASIRIYSIDGALIRAARDDARGTFRWDGRDARGRAVASGVYVCSVESGDARGSMRFVLTP